MTKILIVTPAYDGFVYVPYAIALAETHTLLASLGYGIEIKINVGGSLLVAERNRLTEAFYHSDADYMLCIDSDLGWSPLAVKDMLEKDEEFVAGVYPSRRENIFTFRPSTNDDKSIVVNPEKKLLEMEYIPAGFMLIKRSVIEKMRNKFPELYFEPKSPHSTASKGYCFFNTELRNGEFWGEDYPFCRLAREAGVRIWVDPMIEFDHFGTKGMLMQVLTDDKSKAV